MNEIELLYEKEHLNEILKKNNCLLYGAGTVGRTVVKYAINTKLEIDKILVSDMRNNPSNVKGIPVFEIKNCQEDLVGKCLIVCAMQALHGEIAQQISSCKIEKVFYVSNILYKNIANEIVESESDILYEISKLERKIESQKQKYYRFVKRPCFEYMVLNILDHCNLGCKGCDHFACIAEPYFVSYESICQDLARLSEIFHGDHIMKIGVMGGEPLLHPDLLKILEAVRKHFPYTCIRLTTNGLLLLKQNKEFWRVCRENNVTIVNTKYPINLDFDKMKKKAMDEGVTFIYFEDTGEHVVKKSFKKTINLNGDCDPVEQFANCHISNYGNFLMEGKMYGCPFSCQSYRIFNQKFNQNLRMTECDYLNIYKVDDMQDFFDFAARPKYFCRYCTGLSSTFEWSRSEQKIGEWI